MKVGLQTSRGKGEIAFVDGEFARNAISRMKATRIQRNLKLLTAARGPRFLFSRFYPGAVSPAVVSVFTPREPPPVLAYPPFRRSLLASPTYMATIIRHNFRLID